MIQLMLTYLRIPATKLYLFLFQFLSVYSTSITYCTIRIYAFQYTTKKKLGDPAFTESPIIKFKLFLYSFACCSWYRLYSNLPKQFSCCFFQLSSKNHLPVPLVLQNLSKICIYAD